MSNPLTNQRNSHKGYQIWCSSWADDLYNCGGGNGTTQKATNIKGVAQDTAAKLSSYFHVHSYL